MKLRLFTVRDMRSKSTTNGEYFASKPEAKARRDELNAELFARDKLRTWVVAPGPDHRNYVG